MKNQQQKTKIANNLNCFVNDWTKYQEICEELDHETALVEHGKTINLANFQNKKEFIDFCLTLFPENKTGFQFGYNQILPQELLGHDGCPTDELFKYIHNN